MKCVDCYDRGKCVRTPDGEGCHEGVIGRTATGLPIYRDPNKPWTEEQHRDYERRLFEAEEREAALADELAAALTLARASVIAFHIPDWPKMADAALARYREARGPTVSKVETVAPHDATDVLMDMLEAAGAKVVDVIRDMVAELDAKIMGSRSEKPTK